MDTVSNISKWTSYLTTLFNFDFQQHVFTPVIKIHKSRAGTVHFPDVYKTCSWKSKMNKVVKCDAYLDILLMMSIYVLT